MRFNLKSHKISNTYSTTLILVSDFKAIMDSKINETNGKNHKLHIKQEHSSQVMKCDVCDKEFKDGSKSRLNFHIKRRHGERNRYPCELCGIDFSLRDLWKRHVTM